MPYTDNGRNDGVNGVATGITFLSLHTAWPGTTGTNEVTGGTPAYARKAPTWGSASAGVRTLTGSVTIDVPGASTVIRFIGGWDALTVGNFKAVWAINGADKEVQIDATNDLVLSEAHGFVATDQVVFMGVGGTMPGGLTEGTIYFVIAGGLTTDAFKVATTSGGTAIDITSKGDARLMVSKIVPETYASQGTAVISGLQISVGA